MTTGRSPPGGAGGPSIANTSPADRSTPRPEAKWRRTLREILSRSSSNDERTWLHRFAAERVCGDHTLPSTVSELERDKGIAFERREVTLAGYGGEPARVMAYRVAPTSLQRALELLEPAP